MAVTQEQIDAGRKLHDMYKSGQISDTDFKKRSEALTGLINTNSDTTNSSGINTQGGNNNVNNTQNTYQETPKKQDYSGVPNGVNVANPTKEGKPDYNLDTENRQQEIIQNLTSYKQSNPEIFRDRNTYNSMFSYRKRDDTQKKILDNYFNQVERERNAQINADAGQGKNLSNSDLESLRQNNPDAYNNYMINFKNNAIIDSVTGDGGDIMKNYLESIKLRMEEYKNKHIPTDYKAKFDEYINGDEIQASKDEYAAKKKEIDDINEEMAAMTESLKKQYGNGATRGFILAMAAKKNKALDYKKGRLVNELSELGTNINSRIEQAQKNFELDLKTKGEQDAIDAQVLKTDLGLTKEVFDKSWGMFERDLDKKEKEYWYNKDINSKIALMKVSNKYQKDMARFGYDLEREYGKNIKYISDGNGGTIAIDGDTQVGYFGGDKTSDGQVSDTAEDILGNSLWTKGGTTRLNANTTDWDIAVKSGTSLVAPVSGTITHIIRQNDGNIQAQISTPDGHIITMNHLDPRTLSEFKNLEGSFVNAGDKIGYTGQSGHIQALINGKYEWLTDKNGVPVPRTFSNGKTAEEMLKDGHSGAHLDVRVIGPDGKNLNGIGVRDYIIGGKGTSSNEEMNEYVYGTYTNTLSKQSLESWNNMPEEVKPKVYALLKGDSKLSGLYKSRGESGDADRGKALKYAQRIEPGFSEALGESRYNYKRDFLKVGGDVSKKLEAANISFGHLAKLQELADKMKNNSEYKIGQTVKNFVKSQKSNPDLVTFEQTAALVSTEMAKYYQGGVPHADEVEEMKDILSSNLTLEAISGIIDNSVHLMSSKLGDIGDTYYYKANDKPPVNILVNPTYYKAMKDAGINTEDIDNMLNRRGGQQENMPTHNYNNNVDSELDNWFKQEDGSYLDNWNEYIRNIYNPLTQGFSL